MKFENTEYDEYRITLFKRKLREALPEFEGLRFGRSLGRCHLVLDISWRYKNSDEVIKLILGRFKTLGIRAEAKEMFANTTLSDGKPDYITIPIDQEALPERKRK